MQASIEASGEIPDQESFPVSVNWVQKVQFIGQDEKCHAIVIDASPENGESFVGKATSKCYRKLQGDRRCWKNLGRLLVHLTDGPKLILHLL